MTTRNPLFAWQETKIGLVFIVLFDLAGLYKVGLGFTLGFVGLLQVFVGLGLAVGIASLGIVALRAVQERRSEIELELVKKQAELKYLDETSQKELNVPASEIAAGEETILELRQPREQHFAEVERWAGTRPARQVPRG